MICTFKIWADRNDAVYRTITKDITNITISFWATRTLLMRAFEKEIIDRDLARRGAMLCECIDLPEHVPRGLTGITGAIPGQPLNPSGAGIMAQTHTRDVAIVIAVS